MAASEGLVPNQGPESDPSQVSVDPNAPIAVPPVGPASGDDDRLHGGELPGGANVAPLSEPAPQEPQAETEPPG